MKHRPAADLATAALAVLTLACVGDLSENDAAAAGTAEAGTGVGTGAAREAATRGSLTLEGEPLAAPGEYDVVSDCSYNRAAGAFNLAMHPARPDAPTRGPQGFGARAGWAPGSSIPLADGTYEGEFEYRELAGDGTVPAYRGEAEMTLRIVDDAREASPVVEVTATGRGEGVGFHLITLCRTVVRG